MAKDANSEGYTDTTLIPMGFSKLHSENLIELNTLVIGAEDDLHEFINANNITAEEISTESVLFHDEEADIATESLSMEEFIQQNF